MARKMGGMNKNVTAEKGLALVPKKTRVDWGAARNFCNRTYYETRAPCMSADAAFLLLKPNMQAIQVQYQY
jgi:hypothetical protein